MSFLSKIFGNTNTRVARGFQPLVDRINALEKDFQALSGDRLKEKTKEFRKRLSEGETLDDLLPEAFAAVREAAVRTLGQRHFDVQLIGGAVLHQGKIAEMKTGEGKTLVATLPAYLNALTGRGVHMVTVNDYLSRRDAVWMGQIYHALGMTAGCLNHEASYLYDPAHISDKQQETSDKERDVMGAFRVVHEFLRPVSRSQAYQADVTYGTNNEYGFDYLRDNMVYEIVSMAQRPDITHNFAIVDEVDSILIDEARTPLIISAPDTESTKLYETFSKVVPNLKENSDYTIDEKLKAVSITEEGIEKVEKHLGLKNIYDEGGIRYVHHMEQALRAYVLFQRDRDYVVKDGEVIIVDEFTGRLMPGRRWSDGLHQAVEAKEGVSVQKESRTLATITFQNYFRMYQKLAGMTGTAETSAEEFHKVYHLDVVAVPTHQPMVREDRPDRIYKTEMGKFKAVTREIKERHEAGQPVLVGTVSIEKNELLSAILRREGIPHNVLNAKNHEKEAEIIAQAGRSGGVTVATNMAGRGVDIVLGGNPPNAQEAEKVKMQGGLHVIGTERHEARRIDDQLRGRSGRQGDPGSSQFFVSTEDELVRIFGGDRLKSIMERLGVGEDDVIENRFISNAIQQAQARIEGHNFDTRKYVLEYDDVMNKHRETMYGLRRKIFDSSDNKELVLEYLHDFVGELVRAHALTDSQGDADQLVGALKTLAPFGPDAIQKAGELLKAGVSGELLSFVNEELGKLYQAKESAVGGETMRQLEKMVLLRTIDEIWVDHIETMEHLRDSVRLRAYGQRDPLVEYKIEGQRLYEQLLGSVKAQVANIIFKVDIMRGPQQMSVEEQRPDVAGETRNKRQETGRNVSRVPGAGLLPEALAKVGRNDPCWCGSGKKFKKCHGK